MSSQDTTVSDTLAVMKVLKKYSKEPLIKTILKEALENKNAGVNQTPDEDTVSNPRTTESGYV